MLKSIALIVARPKASGEAIQAFEIRFRVKLPDDFKEFCKTVNGGCPSGRDCYYPMPAKFSAFRAEYDVGLGHIGVSIQDLLGILLDDDRFSIAGAISLYKQHRKPFSNSIPVGTDGSGNTFLLMITGKDFGSVRFFDNETEKTYPIADRYEEFVNGMSAPPKV